MRFLALLLTAMIAVNPVWAQTKAVRPQEPDLQSPLRVRLVDDLTSAVPNSTSIKGYAIQVTDSSGAPVGDAAVALRLPEDGATGHFGSGLRAWVVYTDSAGLARFPVIQWEGSVGVAELRVTAAKGSAHAGLLVARRVGAEQAASILPAKVAAASVPRPAPPPTPQIAVGTPQPDTVPRALADAVPMTASKSGAAVSKASGHTLKPDSAAATTPTHAATQEPAVSITSAETGAGSINNHKKWLVVALIAAAAGVGGVLAVTGHKGSSTASTSSGVSIGTPTISVGH
jgi:hypothetical protein